MTSLSEQLGMGGPAENERIVHDLRVIRQHGLDALRHQIDGHPVSADLYLAVLARLAARPGRREQNRREWADFDRAEAADEARSISRGGNR